MKSYLHKPPQIIVEDKSTIKLLTKTENSIERFFRHDIIINGYGSCRACDCRGYISKHNGTHECKICGHHYDRHRD